MERWMPWATQPHKKIFAGGVAVISAFCALAAVVPFSPANSQSVSQPATWLPLGILVLVQLTTTYVFELCELSGRLSPRLVLLTFVSSATAILVTFGAWPFLATTIGLAGMMVYAAGFSIGSLTWRSWVARWWIPRAPSKHVLMLGDPSHTLAVCEDLMRDADRDLEFLWEDQIAVGDHDRVTALVHFVRHNSVDWVVYPWPLRTDPVLERVAGELRTAGVRASSLPEFVGAQCGRIPLETIDPSWVTEALEGVDAAGPLRGARRVMELVVAAALTTPLLLLGLLIAVVVKLDSRGPVLFVQKRLGYRERPFPLYKFRTMVDNAEQHSGPVWSGPGDARVTRIGKFLRATGLDELPQLINIIKGDMSFIGVRPIRRHFADPIAAEIPHYRLRFLVRPGITGWAQVMHDYAGTVSGQVRKLEYELFYLRYASPLVDTAILLKTVNKVLFRRVGSLLETSDGACAAEMQGRIEADGAVAPRNRSDRLAEQALEHQSLEPSQLASHYSAVERSALSCAGWRRPQQSSRK